MAKKNGSGDVEVTYPLEHRPRVMVVRSDGQRKVFHDGNPFFTQAEFLALHDGYAPSTRERLEFTEAEQAEFDAAQERLRRASALVNGIWNEKEDCRRKSERLYSEGIDDWGNARGDGRALDEEALRLVQEAQAIQARMEKAGELEQEALRERNAVEQRIQRAAIARQRPIQFHTPPRTADEKIADLEGRK